MRNAYERLNELSEQFDIPYQTLVEEYKKELERVQKSTDLGPKKTASFCVQSTDLETLVEVNAIDDNGIFMITTTERLCHQNAHSISKIQFLDHKEWLRINNIGPNSSPVDRYLVMDEPSDRGFPAIFNIPDHISIGSMRINLTEQQRQIVEYVQRMSFVPGNPFSKYVDSLVTNVTNVTEGTSDLVIERIMAWHRFVTCDFTEWATWAGLLMGVIHFRVTISDEQLRKLFHSSHAFFIKTGEQYGSES